jgi:putative flippase GtrA
VSRKLGSNELGATSSSPRIEGSYSFTRISSGGRKRRFGLAGVANVALTNLLLQLLLLFPALPAWFCTLVTQAINGTIGYLLYGKWVFRVSGLRDRKQALRYGFTQGLLWTFNWGAIATGASTGMNRNLTAALAIPALALISYLAQKHWIFCKA